MAKLWEKFVNVFFQYLPSILVCLTFLPAGLIFGYTISSFVAERKLDDGLIIYGPLILGACFGFVMAIAMFLVKMFKGRIIFWHMYILLAAGVFNLIASCFYFANGFDNVGAFISYLAHNLTFLGGLSFLHSIPGKNTRAILLSSCFSFYLMGIAAAVSLIVKTYNKNMEHNPNGTAEQLIDGIYVNFAAVYLSIAIVVLASIIGVIVLNFFGTVDSANCMDNEFRIANSNGSIFDKREEIINRIQFFYVTKNQQWNVTFLLILTEAIQYALFIYFVYWFAMNERMRLTEIKNVDIMLWIVFLGTVLSTICLAFYSAKVQFVTNQICLLILTILSMIICSSVNTTVPLWLVLFFFGMSFSNLHIVLIEVTHFRCTELFIFLAYFIKLISTSVVYYYFVADNKNSYFYSTDESTLMAQGFVFLIITALLALVVGMKVPRTFRTSLFDIQYGLLGIIFMKHQIEQLNVKWLNDGTIPTIST